jgi:hypothetical protein
MVLLLAVIVAILATFAGEYEPPPPAGTVSFAVPAVSVQDPGSPVWRGVGAGESLLPGAGLRTERDAWAKIASGGVEWWLGGSSGLRLGDAGTAELAGGRTFVSCDGSLEGGVRLITTPGEALCAAGEFVAAASTRRLRVACVSGRVTVKTNGDGKEQVLAEGEATMVTQESGACRVRRARVPELTHWLKGFGHGVSGRLRLRQLASVPLDPSEPRLPPAIHVEDLTCRVHLRGPLALVTVRARLQNQSGRPWEGDLSVRELALPVALAATPGSVRLSAGGRGTCEAAAVFVLPEREGRAVLGLNPRVWTGNRVEKLTLSIDASAEEGFDELSCPLAQWSVRKEDSVRWSWSAADLRPGTPVVLEAELGGSNTVDVLQVGNGADVLLLAAWRPKMPRHDWIGRKTNVFVASDVAVSSAEMGRYYGQQVMETVLGALPPGCSTALLAWDGKLRVDPRPLSRHLPARVEDMLAALWDLEVGPGEAGGDFVRQATALAAAAGDEKLLVFVTPTQPAALDWLDAGEGLPPDLRVIVLQLDAEVPSAGWRRLCERSGGAAMAVPPSMAPRLAAMDFLWNLKWGAVEERAIGVAGATEGVVLPPPSTFANQPVVALLRAEREGPTEAGFRVRADGRSRTREFMVRPGEGVAAGELTRRLARSLAARLE